MLNKKLLPVLGRKKSINYSIVRKTIDFQLLEDSGYRILHRPYFAMIGSTKSCYTINPHTKTEVDAARQEMEPMTFDDYLKLFNQENKK